MTKKPAAALLIESAIRQYINEYAGSPDEVEDSAVERTGFPNASHFCRSSHRHCILVLLFVLGNEAWD